MFPVFFFESTFRATVADGIISMEPGVLGWEYTVYEFEHMGSFGHVGSNTGTVRFFPVYHVHDIQGPLVSFS